MDAWELGIFIFDCLLMVMAGVIFFMMGRDRKKQRDEDSE